MNLQLQSLSKQLGWVDREAIEKYLADPWNKKYGTGLWFTPLHEMGEPILLEAAIRNQGGELDWYRTLHALHDGYSFLSKVVEQRWQKVLKHECPKKIGVAPSELQKWQQVGKALLGRKSYPLNWRRKKIETENQWQSFTLTEIETEALLRKLQGNKVSLTSYLPYHFSSLFAEIFLSSPQILKWMIPTRHAASKIQLSTSMNAAYLGLHLDLTKSIHTLHSQLRDRLASGEHHGTNFLAKTTARWGQRFIRQLTKLDLQRKNPSWFASFSNLGKLEKTPSSNENSDILFLHPVRFHRPLGLIALIWNDRLTVTLQIHHSLDCDTEQILKAWNKLLNVFQGKS
jgi:hypothetical protein